MPFRLSRTLLTTVALLAVAFDAVAQPTPIRYSFKAGQRLIVTFDETNAVSRKTSADKPSQQEASFFHRKQLWTVKDVDGNGDATIEVRFQSEVTRFLTAGGAITFDLNRSLVESNPSVARQQTDRAELEGMEQARALMARIFLDRPIVFTVSTTGRVKTVKGFSDDVWDEWRRGISLIIADKAERAQLDTRVDSLFGEQSITNVFGFGFFTVLPPDNVAVGHEWTDQTDLGLGVVTLGVNRRYKLSAIDSATGAVRIAERSVFNAPVVPEEVTAKFNENAMVAEIEINPIGGLILKRTYEGTADVEVYRRGASTSQPISHNVNSVKGRLTIVNFAEAEGTASRSGASDPAAVSKANAPGITSHAYTATVVWTQGTSVTLRGSLFVSGDRARLEPNVPPSQEPFALIFDKAKDSAIVVGPTRKLFARELLTTGNGVWSNFYRQHSFIFAGLEPCMAFQDATGCFEVESERLGGRTVTRFQIDRGVEGRILTGSAWYDQRLGTILKVVTPGGAIEQQNVREGSQPGSLFEVPNGYALDRSSGSVTAPPAAGAPPGQHGPTDVSAFAHIVGTWENTRCGQPINAIRLSVVSGRLVGQFSARRITGDLNTCKIALGESVSLELIDADFDGKVLRFRVENGAGKPELQMNLSGETLFFSAGGASGNAVPYRKVK